MGTINAAFDTEGTRRTPRSQGTISVGRSSEPCPCPTHRVSSIVSCRRASIASPRRTLGVSALSPRQRRSRVRVPSRSLHGACASAFPSAPGRGHPSTKLPDRLRQLSDVSGFLEAADFVQIRHRERSEATRPARRDRCDGGRGPSRLGRFVALAMTGGRGGVSPHQPGLRPAAFSREREKTPSPTPSASEAPASG